MIQNSVGPKVITDGSGNVWDRTGTGWYIQRDGRGGHYADDRYDHRSREEIQDRWGIREESYA